VAVRSDLIIRMSRLRSAPDAGRRIGRGLLNCMITCPCGWHMKYTIPTASGQRAKWKPMA